MADYGFVATIDREIRHDLERDVSYRITDTWEEKLVDMLGAPATDDTKLGRRMTEFATGVRQDTYEIYDRASHARTALLMERGARMSREAWGRSMDASDLACLEVMSLCTTPTKYYGKMIFINGNYIAGYDKSKGGWVTTVISWDTLPGKCKHQVVKEGFDLSDMTEEQVQTNMALMAFSDSKQESNVVCENESNNSKENSNKSLVKEQVSHDKSSFIEGYGPNTSKSISEVEPKKVRKNDGAPTIEDWVSDDKELDESKPKSEKKTVIPTAAKIKFTKPENHEKPVKKQVREKRVNAVKSLAYWVWRPTKSNGASMAFKNTTTLARGRSRKQHRASCKSKVLNPITKPLFMLHMDLFGPTIVSSLMHKKYCLVVTDDYSRFTWFFFLTTKDETSEILKNFIKVIENLVDKKVKIIRSDNGTEFKNKVMDDFVRKGTVSNDSVDGPNNENDEQERFRNDSSTKDVNAAGLNQQSLLKLYLIHPGWKQCRKNFCNSNFNKFGYWWISLMERRPLEQNRQEEGIDYEEVFAPVARDEAIRLFLAYASFMGFLVYQMDVKSAFLYGTIKEEGYVTQPPGFKYPYHPDKVYKVVKALYGLHQAPRAWYETLANYLLSNGFKRGKIDQTLFIKKQKGDILLVQVYVDDIIFGSTNKELCTGFEKLMKDKFQMSSMGELTFFLGLQVQQKEDGIFISQDKYVAEILKKFNYSDVKSASTPVDLEKPLVKDGDADDVDVHLYRSMIGSLMYLTASRPDIMFAVCACARFQVTPKTSHLLAVKRIFRYLKGKPTLGLWYSRDSPFELVAYTDSDYAGATQDRKSTTGGCQFLGNRLISWQCKKQTVVATSTTEAEYVAAASCCGQVLWIQNQLLDYGYNFMNTVINIDNNNLLTKGFDAGRFQYLVSINTARQKITTTRKMLMLKDDMGTKVATVSNSYLLRGGISKEVGTARYLSLVVPLAKVGDEAVHKELGDRMKRAATTASSLEAKQDNTILGGVNAQTRFEITSKQSIDPPLSRGYTLGSGEDNMKLIGIDGILYTTATAKVQTVNGVRQLQALVDKKRVIVLESSIRRDLYLDDAEGTDCLPTTTIFYLKNGAYGKFNLSKYIFDAMVKHLDRGVKFLLYPCFLQVFNNQQLGNMSTRKKIFVNPFHTKKVFANMRRAGKDFSGRVTPLFDTMMVQPVEDIGEDSDNPPDSTPTPIIDQLSSSSQPSKDKSSKRLIDKRKRFLKMRQSMRRVYLHLPMIHNLVDAQAKEIAALKKRIQKLERRKMTRPTGPLYTTKNDSPAGESFLLTAGVEDSVASTIPITVEETLAQTLMEIKAAKPKAKGIVFHDHEEQLFVATNRFLPHNPQSKTKEKIARDNQAKLDAELLEEQKLARKQEDEANIALIES
ncbi:putative ribonuclease H-like domain-containing protein [Tanacetum coccineum]